MTWTYQQSTGQLLQDDKLVGVGYSGAGKGENNPESQNIPNVGPIPVGSYTLGDAYDDIGNLGPCVMRLTPLPDTETFGRSGFFMHGDNKSHNQSASHGCIIMGPVTRNLVSTSGDKNLMVIS